jgi:hypothetical protein
MIVVCEGGTHDHQLVMPSFMPGIHVLFFLIRERREMAGTSPAMTRGYSVRWAKARCSVRPRGQNRVRAVPTRRWYGGRFCPPSYGALESSTAIGWAEVYRLVAAAARGAMRSAARRRSRHERGVASNEFCSSLHHLISGRTALARTHIPHACGEESHEGWDPSTRRLLCWPEGGTVTIHPALTAASAAAPARPFACVTLSP